MPIQKVKAGRIITTLVNDYVGEKGILFYDEDFPEIRLSDGITPGGIPIVSGAGGTGTYTLVTATNIRLGGIKVGPGLSITSDGILSANSTSTYVLPIASTSTLGGIRVGANLYIDANGILSANTLTSGISDTFKTIVTQGSPNLVASSNDTLEFIAGASISIVSSATSSPYKSITIAVSEFIGNLDGGSPDTIYGGTVNIDGGTV